MNPLVYLNRVPNGVLLLAFPCQRAC